MAAAAYVGRVGGLAIALGVGAALAGLGAGPAGASPAADATDSSTASDTAASTSTRAEGRARSPERSRAGQAVQPASAQNPRAARTSGFNEVVDRAAASAQRIVDAPASAATSAQPSAAVTAAVEDAADRVTLPADDADTPAVAVPTAAPAASAAPTIRRAVEQPVVSQTAPAQAAAQSVTPLADRYLGPLPGGPAGSTVAWATAAVARRERGDSPYTISTTSESAVGGRLLDAGSAAPLAAATVTAGEAAAAINSGTAVTATDPISAIIQQVQAVIGGIVNAVTQVISGIVNAVTQIVSAVVNIFIPASKTNHAPIITGSTTTSTDTATGIVTGTVAASDADNDVITYSVTVTATRGDITIDPMTGAYTYTPSVAGRNASATGMATTDSFTVTAADPFGATSISSFTVAIAPNPAHLTFNLIYSDTGWSAANRIYLQQAADYLASYFVVPTSATIDVTVSTVDDPDNNYLALGGPMGFGRYTPTTGWELLAQTEILTGVDNNGADPDSQIIFNLANPWSGTESQTYGYTIQTVAIHELLHGLGFWSMVDASGQWWDVWDTFMTDSAGNHIIGNGIVWTGEYASNLGGGNGGLYFDGPNAVAAWGGPIPLGDPSHLNDPDNPRHVWGGVPIVYDVEIGVLRDLGYTIVAQPVLITSPTLNTV